MNNTDWSNATWRKSSHSGGQTGQCVEVARLSHTVGLRDSKNPHTAHLTVTTSTFTALLNQVKTGQLDL